MNIVFLDAKSVGHGVDWSPIRAIGKLDLFDETSPDQVIERAKDAEVILVNKVKIFKNEIDGLPKLKRICLAATGMDNVDVEYARSKGIVVKNVVGYSTASVAQHTIGLALTILNKIFYYTNYVKDGHWSGNPPYTHLNEMFTELEGKRWGIIGMGKIGNRVAQIAAAMGAEVVYHSVSGAQYDSPYKRLALDELMQSSQVISIHAPLNTKTLNLIDTHELKLMQSEAVLINVGRGGIINEFSLAQIIKQKKINVALDVSVNEPMTERDPLYEHIISGKILMAPHIAWASLEARNRLLAIMCKNITD